MDFMSGTLITRLAHFLDHRGCIAPMAGHELRLAEFLTNIVATITHDLDGPLAPITCRRRPRRKPCPGILEADFGENGEIVWECPRCRDHGVITEWENSFWDLMRAPKEARPTRTQKLS